MLPFRLTCLGPPQLVGPDGDPVRFRTRKHLGLLVFLAIEPSITHRRDRLATLLWPEAELEEGRHSLATALSVLRGRLGADAFETTRDTIRLLPGRVVTDVGLLASGDPLEEDTLVAGAFLDEFEIPRAPDFQHWVDTERARLLPLVHDHLASRIDHARRSGDTRRLEATAEQLLRIDGLSEEATRARVEARAMAGDRIGALRIYDRWRTRLAEDLGATPAAPMQRMADRLRRRGVERSESGGGVAPVPTEQWQERLFVGRGPEFRDCYQVWERAREGEPRHVLVRGESGVGKSTLVGRVATSLALEGASIARVQCYELERELPFGVVGSLVNHLLDLPGAAAVAPAHLAELGRLVTKVRQRWPSLPEPSGATGESARIQLTEAVMALVAALAEEQPVVLVVDDLHLADATSLAVIHLMLRRLEALPVMVLLTLTTGAEALPPAAARFTERPEAIATTVQDLGPLPEVHAAALLEAMLAGAADPGPTVRRAILTSAAGNPMILELLASDWRRRGDGSLALTLSAMTADATTPAAAAFARLTEGMLGSLDRESRAVADLAAILGQRLNDLAMYTLVDLPVGRTMRAMATLTNCRLLRDANSHLEFTNEIIRSHCYLSMPGPVRRLLHSQVADRLLLLLQSGEAVPGLEVAWHLVRGGRLAEAVPHLLSGGRDSILSGAPHEADMALSTSLPALTGDASARATTLLAEALQELGRWSDSQRVLAMFQGAEPRDRDWREVLKIRAARWIGRGESRQCVEEIDRLLDIAESTQDADAAVKALVTVPYFLSQSRDQRSADRFHEVLQAHAEMPLPNYGRVEYGLALAWSYERRGERTRARAILDGSLSVIDEMGYKNSAAIRVLIGSGALRLVEGEYEAALPYLERAAGLARQIDNSVHLATASTSLAVVHGRLGNYPKQISCASQALELLDEADWSMTSLGATYEKALGLAFEGRDTEAQAVAAQLDRKCGRQSPAWALQAGRLMKADVLAITGDEPRAIQLAKRALRLGDQAPLLIDIAGLFARWTAIVAMDGDSVAVAMEQVKTHVLGNKDLHARDRVEALAALAAMEEQMGVGNGSTRQALGREAAHLPPPAMAVLRRLSKLAPKGLAPGAWGVK